MSTEAIWAERVAEWKASGMTSIAFAAGQEFSAGGLRHWAYRLRRTRAEARAAKGKREVRLARVLRSAAAKPVAVELARGRATVAETPVVVELGCARVAVQRGGDRATLVGVLELLAGLARGAS